jgi:hypothetical protein
MRRKHWLFLGTIIGLSSLAMLRLHAMSGYCTPRHAMVVAWLMIPASAAGLNWLVSTLARATAKLTNRQASLPTLETTLKLVSLGCFLALWGPSAFSAIDPGFRGYRQAGEWLASSAPRRDVVLDPKGFSLFYAGRPGYTFATLERGVHDPNVRWVIAHEALVYGPWDYSKAIRAVVGDRRPVRIFPEKPVRRVSKVYVFDLSQSAQQVAGAGALPSPARR